MSYRALRRLLYSQTVLVGGGGQTCCCVCVFDVSNMSGTPPPPGEATLAARFNNAGADYRLAGSFVEGGPDRLEQCLIRNMASMPGAQQEVLSRIFGARLFCRSFLLVSGCEHWTKNEAT